MNSNIPMNTIANFIKKLFYQLIKVVILIIKKTIFVFPFYIIMIVAIHFMTIRAEDKFSIEQLKIIIASTGIMSILSWLSFRAASASKNENEHRFFYIPAIRFFYATFLFVFAIPLCYLYNKKEFISKLVFVSSLNTLFNINIVELINAICFVFTYFFLFTGLLIAAVAMMCLSETFLYKKLLE